MIFYDGFDIISVSAAQMEKSTEKSFFEILTTESWFPSIFSTCWSLRSNYCVCALHMFTWRHNTHENIRKFSKPKFFSVVYFGVFFSLRSISASWQLRLHASKSDFHSKSPCIRSGAEYLFTCRNSKPSINPRWTRRHTKKAYIDNEITCRIA